MKKIVITGISGFVASHFIEYLYRHNVQWEIHGISRSKPRYNIDTYLDKLTIRLYELDLTDPEKTRELFESIKPDYVLHLAAFSSVAYSWKFPEISFMNNCNIFLNVIDAIRHSNPSCRILSVGSSEEYGNISHEDLPIRENQPLRPISPYAVARVSQEQLAKVYAEAYGMNIIMTRSFNHIGPRQDERFVVPSFIKRILDIKFAGETCGEIETGDLSIVRDFVDVRDVVDAYYKLLVEGHVGAIYNICSGKPIKLNEIVQNISDLTGIKVTTRINPDYVRPNDIKEIVGASYKIERELGWERKIPINQTLRDMVICQISSREGYTNK